MKRLKTSQSKKWLKKTIEALKSGGLIVYPTETCYGLGADATNKNTVKKLLQYKGQRGGKAISIAVSSKNLAQKYVSLNQEAENIYKKFLPGPITVISKSRGEAVGLLQAGKESLGVRIPNHPVPLKIVRRYDRPITATSANTSGKKPPYSFSDWQKYTSVKKQNMIDLFLDVGPLPRRQPSTVVDTTLLNPKVLRQGKIKLNSPNVKTTSSAKKTQDLAQEIWEKVEKDLKNKPIIFALQGELGAGKTQFAKGLGQALGVKENINSPTYTIIKEYPIESGVFYHLDAWRLETEKDLKELGLEKMLKPKNVVVIEWLEKASEFISSKEKQALVVYVSFEVKSKVVRKIKYQLKT